MSLRLQINLIITALVGLFVALLVWERIDDTRRSVAEEVEASSLVASQVLRRVSDAYGRGIVSVTDLIDAQEADLSSQLAAAQARFNFLADFIDVLRATGSFDVLLDPGSRNAWYERVDAWFRRDQQ